jgi:Na+/glutamate symporter
MVSYTGDIMTKQVGWFDVVVDFLIPQPIIAGLGRMVLKRQSWHNLLAHVSAVFVYCPAVSERIVKEGVIVAKSRGQA